MPVPHDWGSPAQRRFEPLEKRHNRAAFSCGNPPLDRFLQTQALQEMKRMVSGTRVLVDSSAPDTILGYYSLANAGVLLERIPLHLSVRLPKYPEVPATLLGRLARDQAFRGQGLGERLLVDALRTAYLAGESIGSAVVLVDAINEEAGRFYMRYGFASFADRPTPLFQMMHSVRATLRAAKLSL